MKKIKKILIIIGIILTICQIGCNVYAYTLQEVKDIIEYDEMDVDEKPEKYDVEINAEDLLVNEELPCITKSIESVIYGNKGFFNANFFDKDAVQNNLSEDWKKIAKIVQTVFKVSLYIVLALMLTLLIYVAILLVSYGVSDRESSMLPIPFRERLKNLNKNAGMRSKVFIEQWFLSIVILALMAFIISFLTSFSGILTEWADNLVGETAENYITVFVRNAKKSGEKIAYNPGGSTSPSTGSSNLSSEISNMLGSASGNEKWSVYAANLSSGGEYVIYNSNIKMPAASVIKLFIASAAYEKQATDAKDTSKTNKYKVNESDMSAMITVSDNNAANRIIDSLGGINQTKIYIHYAGYAATDLNRKFGTTNYTEDNYTSAEDVAELLTGIYNNRCAGASNILNYMKKQQRTNKIPQGVPSGVVVANKTGELDAGYPTGPAENDAAIVYKENANYLLVIFSCGFSDSSAAISKIKEISKKVYDSMGESSSDTGRNRNNSCPSI